MTFGKRIQSVRIALGLSLREALPAMREVIRRYAAVDSDGQTLDTIEASCYAEAAAALELRLIDRYHDGRHMRWAWGGRRVIIIDG